MPRAKNRVASRTRRKKVVKSTKGHFGKRNSCIAFALDSFWRAGKYNYRDRRRRKRDFRSLWIIRINAGVRQNGMSYSHFIKAMKDKGIELNRKTLADLAMHEPALFSKLVAEVKA